eukprot:10102116-Ditylum_brightwellii.AAC.1
MDLPVENLQYLIVKGADVHAQNDEGKTAGDYDIDIAKLLMAKGDSAANHITTIFVTSCTK